LFGASVFGFEGLKTLFVLFVAFCPRRLCQEIVKDIEDMEGDKSKGLIPASQDRSEKGKLSCSAYRISCKYS